MQIREYIKATLLALSIWIVAILINTIVVLYWESSVESEELSFEMAGFIISFSALFSSPGLLILWFTSMSQLNEKELFKKLLIAAFSGSLLASLVVMAMFGEVMVNGSSILILCSPIIMAVLSVGIHKPVIDRITEKYFSTHT